MDDSQLKHEDVLPDLDESKLVDSFFKDIIIGNNDQ